MLAQLILLRVEGGDQQRLARVAHREALSLDGDHPGGEALQQQVGDRLIQEVDVVDLPCEESRGKRL